MFVVRKKMGMNSYGINSLSINLDRVNEFFVISNEITFHYKDLSIDLWDGTVIPFKNEEEAQRIFYKICSHIESCAKICVLD